jgi:hypothetical protein
MHRAKDGYSSECTCGFLRVWRGSSFLPSSLQVFCVGCSLGKGSHWPWSWGVIGNLAESTLEWKARSHYSGKGADVMRVYFFSRDLVIKNEITPWEGREGLFRHGDMVQSGTQVAKEVWLLRPAGGKAWWGVRSSLRFTGRRWRKAFFLEICGRPDHQLSTKGP